MNEYLEFILGLPTVLGTGTAVQKTAHGRVDNGVGRTRCRKSQGLDGTKGLAEREIYISTQIFFFSTRLTPPLPPPSIYGNFGHVCMFFREEFVGNLCKHTSQPSPGHN